jgi:pimeloyl-ACP methyl ester carboxylesterase
MTPHRYSPEARPPAEASYAYTALRDDVYELADAANFSSHGFHLVGHDHGALLGWFAASGAEGDGARSRRILSYSALSVPHPAAFSAALFGPSADLEQQMASQYFTMFTLPNSSTLHGDLFYSAMGKTDRYVTIGSVVVLSRNLSSRFLGSVLFAPESSLYGAVVFHSSKYFYVFETASASVFCVLTTTRVLSFCCS